MNELKNNMMEKSLSQVSRVSFAQDPSADSQRINSGKALPVDVAENAVVNDEKVKEAVSRINGS